MEEINNKSGKKTSKGQISKVFYDLLKDYWLGAQDVVQPYEIKQIVTNITSQVNNKIIFNLLKILYFKFFKKILFGYIYAYQKFK